MLTLMQSLAARVRAIATADSRLQTAGKNMQVPDCNINEFKAAMMARAMMSTLNSVSVQGNIVN